MPSYSMCRYICTHTQVTSGNNFYALQVVNFCKVNEVSVQGGRKVLSVKVEHAMQSSLEH